MNATENLYNAADALLLAAIGARNSGEMPERYRDALGRAIDDMHAALTAYDAAAINRAKIGA